MTLLDLSLAEESGDHNGVRIHPLIAEYACGARGDVLAGELAQAARHLERVVAEPAGLFDEYLQRGFAEALGDVRVALAWTEGGSPTERSLRDLQRVLDREAAAVYAMAEPGPAVFLSLLFNRAKSLQKDRFASRVESCLADLGRPWFRLRWRTDLDSPALERTIRIPASTLAFLPDGQRLLCGGSDGALRVVDADLGRIVRTDKIASGGCPS